MSKIAVVKLNESSDVVKIVGGIEDNPSYGVDDNRLQRAGIAFFLNDKYILSFVTLTEEIELLKSDLKVKAVHDLGFNFYAHNYSLMIQHKNSDSSRACSSHLMESIEGVVNCNGTGCVSTPIYDEVHLTCDNKHAWAHAIKLAMDNPVQGTNVWHCIPQDMELEEVVF